MSSLRDLLDIATTDGIPVVLNYLMVTHMGWHGVIHVL